MNYQQFKNIIENEETVNETFYNQLIEENGVNKTHNFFERYINNLSEENKIDGLKKVSYYLERIQKDEQDELFNEIPDFDILGFYLKEINSIPLLTESEQLEMMKRISELKNKIKNKNITKKNLNISLANQGIKNGNLFEKSKKLKTFIEENTETNNINELRTLLNDLELYNSFETLINKFIEHNLRLVPPIAKKYTYYGVSILDLIQEGNIGLKAAVIKFNIEKGCKFSTYADFWINNHIRRSLADYSKRLRVPYNVNEELSILRTIEKNLEHIYHRTPSDKEIVQAFHERAKKLLEKAGKSNPTHKEIIEKANMSEEKVRHLRKLQEPIVYLSTPVGEEEDTPLMEFVSDETKNTESEAINNIDKKRLKEIIQSLKLRYQLIIILRHGLALNKYMSYENFAYLVMQKKPTISSSQIYELYMKYSNTQDVITLEEIGEILDISKQRVSKLEEQANEKLIISFKR